MLQARNHILLIDDEPSLVELFRAILRREGLSEICLTDPEEALRFFETNHDKVALAVVDVIMPKLTGIELSQHFYSIDPDVPVVLITAHLHPVCIRPQNVKTILYKPFSKKDFLSIVATFVKRGSLFL